MNRDTQEAWNESGPKEQIFDVFLCHNSEDKPAVREISRKLAERNIKAGLDEEEIRPRNVVANRAGTTNRKHKVSSSFCSGLGPWQNQEIQALLSQFVKRKCPVIPVVLSSAKTTPDLPWTLGGGTARVGGKGAPTAQPTAKNFAP